MAGATYIEHGNGRPWHKRVLIPFWVLQIILIGIQIAGAAIALYWNTSTSSTTFTTYNNGDNTTVYTSGNINSGYTTTTNGSSYVINSNNTTAIAIYAVILAIACIALLLSIAEIILFARHHLTPTKYFVFNLLKFLWWTSLLIIAIVDVIRVSTYIFSFAISIAEWLIFLGSLIYGSVIFHRFRMEKRAGGTFQGVKQQQQYGDA
ncbi:hypothetical protein MMC19_001182 [Ptychographa xylographoides]|nr:hypothetical protein [Ptychographa xylographoides]